MKQIFVDCGYQACQLAVWFSVYSQKVTENWTVVEPHQSETKLWCSSLNQRSNSLILEAAGGHFFRRAPRHVSGLQDPEPYGIWIIYLSSSVQHHRASVQRVKPQSGCWNLLLWHVRLWEKDCSPATGGGSLTSLGGCSLIMRQTHSVDPTVYSTALTYTPLPRFSGCS